MSEFKYIDMDADLTPAPYIDTDYDNENPTSLVPVPRVVLCKASIYCFVILTFGDDVNFVCNIL